MARDHDEPESAGQWGSGPSPLDLRIWAVGKAVEIVNKYEIHGAKTPADTTRVIVNIAKDLHAYVMGESGG